MAYATTERACSLDYCSEIHYSKGWCRGHYDQQLRGKELAPIKKKRRKGWPEGDQFWDQVDLRDFNGCWEWIGYSKNGRGYFKFTNNSLVHRYSYQFFNPDEDIDGVTIHHKCANSLCVNPDHLQPLSLVENVAEMHERQNYLRKIAQLEAEVAELKSQLRRLENGLFDS